MPNGETEPDEVETASEVELGEAQEMPEGEDGRAAAVDAAPPDYSKMQEMIPETRKAAGPELEDDDDDDLGAMMAPGGPGEEVRATDPSE